MAGQGHTQRHFPDLSPIAVPRAHDVLATQLRDRIFRGEFAVGELLPPERDLVQQSGLTRGIVRDALHILAVEGLIQTRRGRGGGSVVTLPTQEAMTSAISRFVQGHRLSISGLHETRELLEPFLARCAAERRTEQALQELLTLHSELEGCVEDPQKFGAINIAWHKAVAKASGNELLSTLLSSIAYGMQHATTAEEYNAPSIRRQVLAIHTRVNEAIQNKQPDTAESAMRIHMTASRRQLLASLSKIVPLSNAIAHTALPAVGPFTIA